MRSLCTLVVVSVFLLAMNVTVQAGDIHQAIISGDVDLVAKMLQKDPSLVNDQDENNQFLYLPLHTAASHGQLKIAKLLIKAGADVDGFDSDESTPLHVAAVDNQPELVTLLLKAGADVNRRDKNGGYSLSFALSGGNEAIVQQMLDAGADLNYIDSSGTTLLHMAASRGLREFARKLIENGADINAATQNGMTVLHYAVSSSGEEFVEELITLGADLDVPEETGWTPLIRAAFYGRPVAARALIAHGADVNRTNNWGATPLHGAARHGEPEIIELLLKNGAKVETKTDDGETPLVMAVANGEAESVRLLLEAGASPQDKAAHFGHTVLHVAASKGYADVAGLLLDQGASWRARDDAGRTAVELAARYGHKDVVDRLVSNGASAGNLDVNECTLASWEQPPKGEALIWYLGHSGWAIKTHNHLLVFDYFDMDDRDPVSRGLCNGYINCDELANENVTVFASHAHRDHFDPAIFEWREHLSDVTYVLGCTAEGQTDYTLMKGREKKKINGMKVRTIESNDSGVGFVIDVDGLTILHPGDHANRHRDFSGTYKAEIEYLDDMGVKPDIAFMPISGCGFGDLEAVKMGVHYTLETLKPKVFIPMHGGSNSWRYHEFIADCRDMFPETRMDAPINRGDLMRYRDGSVSERLALK
jgi:ankyrin repeat protein/L-ascorbate metabolism protein UlaG (beta-lactamase superfamily)